jgi:Domain of unknown function (DUF4253)
MACRLAEPVAGGSMVGEVPGDGELRVGSVSLPFGKRVHGTGPTHGDEAVAVAWVTIEEVPQPGPVWAALSAESPTTGLMPFLLGHLPGDRSRPWDTEEFWDLADPAGIDRFDVAGLLEENWDGATHEGEPEDWAEEDPQFVAYIEATIAPFGREFPGLAPAEETPLEPVELDEVLRSLPARRIGLAPASRPADVLPLIGWSGATNSYGNSLPIAAVLRSWEERFGARLLEVGFGDLSVLASRPPRTTEHARRLAAEQWTFCNECGNGLTDIPAITAQLLNSPRWSFWWD